MEISVKICPNKKCRMYNIVMHNNKFCVVCGTKMEDTARCQCGEPINPRENFCSECGRPTK